MPKSKSRRAIHMAGKAKRRCLSLGAAPRGNIHGTASTPKKWHLVAHGNASAVTTDLSSVSALIIDMCHALDGDNEGLATSQGAGCLPVALCSQVVSGLRAEEVTRD